MSSSTNVSSPEELKAFVAQAGDKLLVVDLRNPDSVVEPEDVKTFELSQLPTESHRPHAINLVWDRETNQMPLPAVPKDTPIITHCGSGYRGQMAKAFLEESGFENVLNGGGPKKTNCWAEFGDK